MKRWLGAIAVAAASVAFVIVNAGAPRGSYDALPVLLSKAGHLFLWGVFWFAVYVAGRGFLRRAWMAPPPELAVVVGVVVVTAASFILAATSLAYGWIVKAGVAAAAAAGTFWLRKGLARAGQRAGDWWRGLSLAAAAMGAVLLALLLPQVLTACHPPINGAALAHYVAAPAAIARRHGFVPAGYDWYTGVPMSAALFQLAPFLWNGVTAAGASHLVASALTLCFTYRLGRLHLDQGSATIAAALVALSPWFYRNFGSASGDHFTSAFVAAAAWLVLGGVGGDGRNRAGVLAHAGLLVGSAVANRYAGLPALVAAVLLFGYGLVRRKVTWGQGLGFAAGTLAALAPWLAKAWLERGDPFFPLASAIWGARGINPAAMAAWAGGWGAFDIVGALTSPYRATISAGSAWLPITLPLAALAFITWPAGRRITVAAWLVFFLYGVCPRLSPSPAVALPLLAVAAAGALAGVRRGWPERAARWWRWATSAAVVAAALPLIAGAFFAPFPNMVYIVMGDKGTFLSSRVPTYAAESYINVETAPTARVLLLYTADVLYLERDAVYACEAGASPFLLSACERGEAGLYELCRRRGVTHALVDLRGEKAVAGRYPPGTRERVRAYLARYGVLVYRDRVCEVYELL